MVGFSREAVLCVEQARDVLIAIHICLLAVKVEAEGELGCDTIVKTSLPGTEHLH